jgi:hypothetical protein
VCQNNPFLAGAFQNPAERFRRAKMKKMPAFGDTETKKCVCFRADGANNKDLLLRIYHHGALDMFVRVLPLLAHLIFHGVSPIVYGTLWRGAHRPFEMSIVSKQQPILHHPRTNKEYRQKGLPRRRQKRSPSLSRPIGSEREIASESERDLFGSSYQLKQSYCCRWRKDGKAGNVPHKAGPGSWWRRRPTRSHSF